MSEDQIEVTEEELDAIADTAIAALQDILKYFNVGEVTIDEYEGDEGELILDITGDDLAILIGRHGRTLDALAVCRFRHHCPLDGLQLSCYCRRRGL